MKSNIVLIGFMGSGKSLLGNILAGRLAREFVETDNLVTAQAGKDIPRIFREDGEAAFRQRETEVTRAAARRERLVIATGGGVVLDPENVKELKRQGILIYLATPLESILARVARDPGKRPLLARGDREAAVRDLMQQRRPLYEAAADITVNTSGLSPETVATQIIRELKSHADFSF